MRKKSMIHLAKSILVKIRLSNRPMMMRYFVSNLKKFTLVFQIERLTDFGIDWERFESVYRDPTSSLTHIEQRRIIDLAKTFVNGYVYLYCEKVKITERMYKDEIGSSVKGFDIRVLWEFSRMQVLVQLALAYILEKNEVYYYAYIKHVKKWIEYNECESGLNWHNAMEVSIRMVNLIESYSLLSSKRRDSESDGLMNSLIVKHFNFIIHNMENNLFVNNHYFFNLTGLFWTVFLFDRKSSKKILKYCLSEILEFVKVQFDSEGVNIEKSTSYHASMIETLICLKILCRNNSMAFPVELNRIILKGAEFVIKLTKNDEVLVIGDNDSGRFLIWDDMNTHGLGCYTNIFNYCNQGDKLRYRYDNLLDYKFSKFTESAYSITLYTQFGILIYKNKGILFTVKYGNNFYGYGGHVHNDQLSITLSIDGQSIICDSGCCSYNANHSERRAIRSEDSHSTVYFKNKPQNIMWDNDNFKIISCSESSVVRINNGYKFTIMYSDGSVLHRSVTFVHGRIRIEDSSQLPFEYSLIFNEKDLLPIVINNKYLSSYPVTEAKVFENYNKSSVVKKINLTSNRELVTEIFHENIQWIENKIVQA